MLVKLPTAWSIGIIRAMKAKELIRRRVAIAENCFADIVVWHVPEPVLGSTHAFKYRLAFVVDCQCVLRYDNESGKGDHRHIDGQEYPYIFSSPRQLTADFFDEIARWRHERAYN